jgi:glycosyltransferase involved in cell wall biosynthesis
MVSGMRPAAPLMARSGRRLKLAVLANEFMAPAIGRTGGFGWAARQVARVFAEHPEQGVDVVFVTGELRSTSSADETVVHGTRLLFRQPRRRVWRTRRMLARERLDLILAIDYLPDYRAIFWMVPRVPIVIWARDPRTPDDIRRIGTLRIPGQEDVVPQGIEPFDARSLGRFSRIAALIGRPVLLASKMAHIAAKLPPTYGMESAGVLPNPDVLDYASCLAPKADHPRVVFLARLDPYKRPWLFVELARRFPDVEFLILGRSHFQGPGSWQPVDLPANVSLCGHVDGAEKVRLLASAWALVNTSIYEESPVSMLEALACETPILSCVDSGDIAPRFGIYTGRFDGTGMEALPALADGLGRLLRDRAPAAALARAGREWVTAEHSTARFFEAFDRLCARAGVAR